MIFKQLTWGGFEIKEFIKSFGPLLFQTWIPITLIFLLVSKDDIKLVRVLYIGCLIMIVRQIVLVGSGYGLILFHNADLAMYCSFVIMVNIFYFPYIQPSGVYKYIYKYRWAINILCLSIPIIGMGRGGTIAVMIPFLLYILYTKKIKYLVYSILLAVVVLYFIENIVFPMIPKDILYTHQGASSLYELLNKTEDVAQTISTRLDRWNILITEFKEHPIFGDKGFTEPILGSINEGFTAWGAHNYLFAIAAGGGLYLIILTLIPLLNIFVRSYKLFFVKSPDMFFGFGLILNVININLSNTYYSWGYCTFLMWIIFGIGLYNYFYKVRGTGYSEKKPRLAISNNPNVH